jgi:acyl carrier protein
MKEDGLSGERQEVFERLTRRLREECPAATEGIVLTWQTNFQTDLSVTSIEVIRLMAGLQHEFRVSLEDQDLFRLVTLGDVVELLLTLRRQSSGSFSWRRLILTP